MVEWQPIELAETPNTFPIMRARSNPRQGQISFIPWAVVASHEVQAVKNHGETLQTLARYGGVSCCELVAILEDRPYRKIDNNRAETRIKRLLYEFNADAIRKMRV